MKRKTEIEQVQVRKDSLESMAEHIAALSAIGHMLKNSRLKERTILLLLKDETNLSMHYIKKVLDALPKLEDKYLK